MSASDLLNQEQLFKIAQSAYSANQNEWALEKCIEILSKYPLHADTHYLQGILLRDAQDFEGAEKAFHSAIRIEEKSDYFRQLGHLYRQLSQWGSAEKAYQKSLERSPTNLANYQNLGQLYISIKDWPSAEMVFQSGLLLVPDWISGHESKAQCLFYQLQFDKALHSLLPFEKELTAKGLQTLVDIYLELKQVTSAQNTLLKALKQEPNNIELLEKSLKAWAREHSQYSQTINQLKKLSSENPKAGLILAQNAYQNKKSELSLQLLKNIPQNSETYLLKAYIALFANQVGEAYLNFNKAFNPPLWEPMGPQKIQHDFEQTHYLRKHGLLNEAQIEQCLDRLRETSKPAHPLYAQPEYNPTQESWPQTLRPIDIKNTLNDYLSQGFAVIDQLLTDQAVNSLYQYCLKTMIWRDYYQGKDYLGAFLEDGFHPMVLLELVSALQTSLPEIFENAPLKYMWAFKYGENSEGIPPHADNAKVNLNFWVTPDQANLDEDRGGLVIYPQKTPTHWGFNQYNSRGVKRFLKDESSKQIIPYRQNRAVLFDSSLFHQSDQFHFRPEYTHRRINITLLFGAQNGG